MKKRHDITAQTKQNLIDAFWQLYCNRPITQITVKDIVQRAGYNRSTFYEYFSDVYEVLETLEAAIIPTMETLPLFDGPHGQIGMPFEQFVQWYQQHAQYYSVLLGERGDPAFAGKLKHCIRPTVMALHQQYPHVQHAKFALVIEYMLSAMIGVMVHWHQHPQLMTIDEVMVLMQRMMEQGVVAELAYDG
jgi:AcrR family transcriptional regulator